MCEIGNSSSHNSDQDLRGVQEINVMLVSHDKQLLVATTELLESFPYKVTTVEDAMVALSMLTERKHDFDLVLVDINLNDLDVFSLVRLIGKMEYLTVLMSEDEDDEILLKALANGAYMLVGTPLSADRVKEIRQHVIRDRMQKSGNKSNEQTNMLGEISSGESEKSNQSKGKVSPRTDDGRETRNKRKGVNILGKNMKRSKKHSNNDQECDSIPENINITGIGRLKKKVCTEWTEELHEKFMDAVNQLGEGRCYPKEILDLMNVPGLTRMQVASHLQKCRNDNWKAPVARKSSQSAGVTTSPTEGSQKRKNLRKFGSMPRLDKNQPSGQDSTVHMNSSSDSEFSGNGRRSQDFRPPTDGFPKKFGSYPYGTSLGRQMVGQRAGLGYNVAYDQGNQTMGNADGAVEINSYGTAAMERTEHTNYDTIFSDLGGGGGCLPGSINQKQPHEDFFNFLRDMDEYHVPSNAGRIPEGYSRVNQTSLVSHQQFVYHDANLIFSDHLQHPAVVNREDIRGEWSADSASYFGKSYEEPAPSE